MKSVLQLQILVSSWFHTVAVRLLKFPPLISTHLIEVMKLRKWLLYAFSKLVNFFAEKAFENQRMSITAVIFLGVLHDY